MKNKVLLGKIIDQGLIDVVYQPIISLDNGKVFAYESLPKGPKGSQFESLDFLIGYAKKHGLIHELEKVIFKKIGKEITSDESNRKHLFFLHIEPESLVEFCKEEKGFKEILESQNIVFEITQGFEPKDVDVYCNALKKCRQNRMRIAIGNFATEKYNFTNIKILKADYIKIDIELVKEIHVDIFKKSVIVAIVKLAEMLGMKTIAEGVEKREEIRTLIELGVDYAQGYYISAPQKEILALEKGTKKDIEKLIINNEHQNNLDINRAMIHNIVEFVDTIHKDETCIKVNDFFSNHDYEGVCVVNDDNNPIGLVMKSDLSAKMATQYGYSIYANRKIELIMDYLPVIVDCKSSIKKVSELATFRSSGKVYDNIIVTKNDKYYGMVSVRNLLMHITSIERNYAKHLNPLTLLPGNQMITYHIRKGINDGSECAIFYADLDNFKIFNDVYGFDSGDKVIKLTGNIIDKYIKQFDGTNGFIGHIGGDDFVFIIYNNIGNINSICNEILTDFAYEIKAFFNEKDKNNGYIEGFDRDGERRLFDLTTLSIAGFVGSLTDFVEVESFGEYISKIKKEAKAIKGNSCIIYDSDKNVAYKYSDKV